MELGNFFWLFPVSLAMTIFFAIFVLVLLICWWIIFRLTIRYFNTEGKRRD